MQELTVEEMFMYTAELKLPVSWTAAARLQRVAEVVKALGLDGCQDTVIGNVLQRGISGGQASVTLTKRSQMIHRSVSAACQDTAIGSVLQRRDISDAQVPTRARCTNQKGQDAPDRRGKP